MTELRAEPYILPAADLGPENPLPVFRARDPDQRVAVGPGVTEEEARCIGWETAFRVLPYRMQDGYNRDRVPRAFASLILENERLRAVVLPELGGRLVSLQHRETGRELLYRNPWFQPANLALRNAWFSGGIEWNLPHLGHHYLTCSPVFAARVRGCLGEPALRIYEWDRLKGIPWQVDLSLPPSSPLLFARIRVVNPRDETIPMYWWTNIAVRESEDVRVLAPADSALSFPGGTLTLLPLPESEGVDVTYSTRLAHAQECFFRIEEPERPWVAALDGEGRGLFQASTRRLRGRKMFCWGTGPGGRRWQEYLGGPGSAYLEIQGGLARTQLESIPMPRAEWSWTEAFGLLEADPREVHGRDWSRARRSAGAAVDRALPLEELENWDRRLAVVTDSPAEEILAAGSGWGALERELLSAQGQEDPIPHALDFPESTLGRDQEPWLELLRTGVFPAAGAGRAERMEAPAAVTDEPRSQPQEPDEGAARGSDAGEPSGDPGQWMVQEEWRRLLEDSVESGRSDHWLAWLHLGVMRLEALDEVGAREAWTRSLQCRRTGWALRNLGALEARDGSHAAACDWLKEAWEAGPPTAALAVEYAELLVETRRREELRELLEGLPEEIRRHERIRILRAAAALEEGRYEEVEPLFQQEFTTIKEGETTLTDLWFRLHERRLSAAEGVPVDDALRRRLREQFPPPEHIDYRLR